MGWFKQRHFENGQLVTHHSCFATCMGYLAYKSYYFKAFRKRPPHWFLVSASLVDQIDTMQKAIEAGKPIPDSKTPTIIIFPAKFFIK